MKICCVCLLVGSLVLADAVWADQRLPDGPFVFGYAGQISVAAGEEIGLHLSSSQSAVDVVIERVGQNRQRVWQREAVATAPQTIPDRASSDGCKWPESVRVNTQGWTSGYYVATLTARKAGKPDSQTDSPADSQTDRPTDVKPITSSLFFIVRAAEPGQKSKVLLQLSTNTYNAYTNWGGHSLYAYHDRDGLQGHRVSFNRPLSSQFESWEGPLVRWAEKEGIELEYAANSDLEFHPEILSAYRLVLSVGHDEYWSSPMRDNLEKFISAGGNVAFFSGNTCCWQVRSEESGRALTCWKQNYTVDPYFRGDQPQLLATLWSHHLIGRPENQLTGVGFLWGGYHRSHDQLMNGPGSYEIHRPEHWVLAGTGLKEHDRFGGKDTIVGYECDGCEMRWESGRPYPTGRDGTPTNFEIIGTCPAVWAPGDSWWYDRFPKDRIGAAVMGVYTRGGTVFTCGSTDWAHGLKGGDEMVAKITRNVIDRLAKSSSTAP